MSVNIKVKFIGQTNHKPARCSAICENGKRVMITRHSDNERLDIDRAAQYLCNKFYPKYEAKYALSFRGEYFFSLVRVR